MKNFIKYIFIPIVILGCVYVGYKWYENLNSVTTLNNIEFIRDHMNPQGDLIDYKDEIGVHKLEDIKLFVKKDIIYIEFGKIKLQWDKEKFLDKDNIKNLKKIGIEVRMYKNNTMSNFKVYYKGEELIRWVS